MTPRATSADHDNLVRLPARVWLVAPAAFALPLLGAALAGSVPDALLAFPPPLEIPDDYPRFSWWAMSALIVAIFIIAAGWVRSRVHRGPGQAGGRAGASRPGRRFPAWGWGALAWTALWWTLAWTRFPWFEWGQRYTFAPLWFGFIISVNAVTIWRGGRTLMMDTPSRWLTLFGASALFWWMFEWLNRFVENWHYPIVEQIGGFEYALVGSICFSTVLPAVLAVRECLDTFPGLQRALAHGPRWRWLARAPAPAVALIATGAAALLLTGAQPRYFYAALWMAPLLLGAGLVLTTRATGWWTEIVEGDWRAAGSWAIAALSCGFFWEMWNIRSLAHWIYTVPFVERWHIFEMPLAGYTGYLPFGLECSLAVAAIAGRRTRRKHTAPPTRQG